MLGLAISIDTDSQGIDIVETNNGIKLRAPQWPQDCEFQMVAFGPSDRTCEVVYASSIAEDISHALKIMDAAGLLEEENPEWLERLQRYAA